MHRLLTLADASQMQTYYALQRFEFWELLLIGVGLLLVFGFIALMYYFDSVELPAGTTVLLAALRTAAFLGLIVFFLGPEKRSRTEIVKTSRVPVLIDTSLSMTLPGVDQTSDPASVSRIQQAVDELKRDTLIEKLRRDHDVVVHRFDHQAVTEEVASLPRFPLAVPVSTAPVTDHERNKQALHNARQIAFWGGALLIGSLVMAAVFFLMRASRAAAPHAWWALMVCVLASVASAVTLGIANLAASHTNLLVIVGLQDESVENSDDDKPPAEPEPTTTEPPAPKPQPPVDWANELTPRGTGTQLYEVVRSLVNKERGGPVAGVVIVTDGQNNEGAKQPNAAIAAARDAKIPVHFIGLGSVKEPKNVRLAKLQAPQRVFPGDEFQVQALIQSFGMEGDIANVKLLVARPAPDSASAADPPADSTVPVDPDENLVVVDQFEDTIQLIEDGKEIALQFTITPKEQGTLVLRAVVTPSAEEQEPRDNEKRIRVQVVDRKNRVLLMAGGPTREFRFLRNQLYRDSETTLDVYLQSGVPGIDQESDNLLFNFPETEEEMFQYDCLVAFDPDWRVLNKTQVGLLESWVYNQAGGLIVVAGPVYTPRWSTRPSDDKVIEVIRGLYPVTFFHRGAPTVKLGRFGGEEAWQLSFTREGRAAEFLWLGESMAESEANWNAFAGVYGYYAVDKLKSGATAYADFSDPATKTRDSFPVYLAGHLYGSGRVFFQASGEMWRVRELDDKFFERYYTQLIRWASQGRLLRDSQRGVLMLDKDTGLVGETVQVTAMLKNPQHKPLVAEQVSAILVQPDGMRTTLTLRHVQGRPGTFVGQFIAKQPGDHRVALSVPESRTLDLLTATMNARMPHEETEKAKRNDKVMAQIAEATGGLYYVGFPVAKEGTTDFKPLASVIPPNDQVSYVTGNPDEDFHELLMKWLLGIICGVLCLEWIIRRLSRLA